MNMIIKYARDKERRPIGCVVAIGRETLGCCFVNKEDRPKTKTEMFALALQRAQDPTFNTDMDPDQMTNPVNQWKVPHCMRKIFNEMIDRSRRYFKQEK